VIENCKYLVDSNIIIYHLNGEQVATNFLKENIMFSAISRLTFIEVLSFDFSQEEKKQILSLLRSFNIIDTSDESGKKAVENRQYKKIKLADNIIASTAQTHNLVLVTRNTKDFTNLDVQVLNIFEIEN
jgi:predicted nucleic acid-binding protein